MCHRAWWSGWWDGDGWGGSKVILGQKTHIASHNMLILFWSYLLILILDMANDPAGAFICSLNIFEYFEFPSLLRWGARIISHYMMPAKRAHQGIDCGIMSAPSPILTRAYSELASGNSAEIASGSQTCWKIHSWYSLKPTFNGVSQLATFEYRRVYCIIIYYKYGKVINTPVDRHLLANSLANRCK